MKEKLKGILLFSAMFVIVDQILKLFLNSKMIVNQSIILIRKFFSITLVHNTGAAFSIFSESRYFLIAIGIIAIIGLLFYIKKLEVIIKVHTNKKRNSYMH